VDLIPFDDFMLRTIGGRPNQMNPQPFVGHRFDCSCGAWHVFDIASIKILRELPQMQLVLACPGGRGVTCVRVRGFFRFKGFDSLFGAVEDADLSAGGGDHGVLDVFLTARLSDADYAAELLWTTSIGIEPTLQARHGIATIVAAIVTATTDTGSADDCIDEATRFIDDNDFESFVLQPEVHLGLQHLAIDAQAAARCHDVGKLAELVQTFLVMPIGGPSSLSPSESEAVVLCAARISDDAITAAVGSP